MKIDNKLFTEFLEIVNKYSAHIEGVYSNYYPKDNLLNLQIDFYDPKGYCYTVFKQYGNKEEVLKQAIELLKSYTVK